MPWRREWQPTPEFLPGKSHGQRSLAGCCRVSMGSQRVRHDLVTKQQQQQQIIMAEYIAVYSSCSKIQTWIVSCLLGQYSLNILQIGAGGYSLDLTGIEDHSDRGLSPLTRLQSSCPLTAQTARPLHPGTSLLETSSSDSCLLKPNRASL